VVVNLGVNLGRVAEIVAFSQELGSRSRRPIAADEDDGALLV
jgi:hypothetical protein